MVSNNKKMVDNVEDLVVEGVMDILKKNNEFVGTMTQLNSKLAKVVGKSNSEMLPGSPSALRIVIDRVSNRLRARAISVSFSMANNKARSRQIHLIK